MKLFVTSVVLCLLFLNNSFAQGGYSWVLKQSGSSLGDPIDYKRSDPDIIFYGTGGIIYKSTNRGESFSSYGSPIPGSSQVKNIILSRYDDASMLVAIEGSPDKIVKTTDSGLTWNIVANNMGFSYFGIPMTPDPSHPDTIYTMSNNAFMRSTDFGDTWTTVATTSGFGSPCDIEVFPDSSNIILVGDNGTGIFRSTDYGQTWSNVFSTTGEIPTIATDNNIPGQAWATRWGGGGGFLKTTDFGATWVNQSFFSGQNMWGVDVAPENSGFIITGRYSGGTHFLTKDEGSSWLSITQGLGSSSNYSIVIIDTITIFAAQSSGLFKMTVPFVPVELTSFSYSALHGKIILNWETATEVNNSGFEIQRRAQRAESIVWKKIGFVPGFGTTTEKKSYSFEVEEELNAKSYFRLKQVDFDGTFEYSEIIEAEPSLPVEFELSQNYPNPFNPVTNFRFRIANFEFVTLKVYDVLGKEIATLVNEVKERGEYKIEFNAKALSSGVYFYKLQAESFTETKKFILMK